MKRYPSSLLLLVVCFASPGLFAQGGTPDDSSIPLVYDVENTGADFPAPEFTAFDWLPIIRPLTDPFSFFDGTRDTSFASWERRRNEIKAAIEHYEIGLKPDTSDLTIEATYVPPPAIGPDAGELTVVVTRNSNGESLTLTSKVWIPPGWGEGPFPALIPMAFFSFGSGPNYGGLPDAVFADRPVATIDYPFGQVASLSFGAGDHSNDPFYRLYPEFCAGNACADGSNSGTYAAWSWGISRLIDGIMMATQQAGNPMPIDPAGLAVTGCSFAGKMALYGGALDERIALTIPIESGGGGATAWRVSNEIEGDREVESLTHTSRDWFAGQLFQFSNNDVYKLPFDHHELMAMVAPRALLVTGNASQLWLSGRSTYVASRATQKIYETFGIGDRFGFIIDTDHGHCAIPESQFAPMAAYVDTFLLGMTDVDTEVRDHLYGDDFDYERWTWWWGKPQAKFPRDWNPGNGKVVMSMNRPLDVTDGTEVKAGYTAALPFAHPDASVTLVGASVQLDVENEDGRSYTLTVPFENTSFLIPEDDMEWFPAAQQKNPLTWQGAATSGFGGHVRNVVFSALGANLTGGAGNPAGPGIATDTGDPVDVRFHVDTGTGGANGSWSSTETVADESQ